MSFKRVLLAGLLFFVTAAVVILSGALDRFSPTGYVNHVPAVILLFLYLVLALVATWIVLRFAKIRAAFFLVLAAVVLVLVAAEVGIRYFHPSGAKLVYQFVYSRDFHHVNYPNSELVFDSLPFGPSNLEKEAGAVFTNSMGLRTAYEREDFLRFPRRVVFLGDSFTFGLYVPLENSFPRLLEKRWRQQLGETELAALNAGLVSYSPLLERQLYEKRLAAFKPEIVVMLFDATDVGDDYQYGRQARTGPDGLYFPQTGFSVLLPSEGDSWSKHCALCQRFFLPFSLLKGFLHPVLMSTEALGPSAMWLEIDGKLELNNYFIYRHPLEKTRPYFEASLAQIAAVAKQVEAGGGKFLLVVSPRFQHWNTKECPKNWEGSQYSLAEPYQDEMFRFFEERRATLGFPLLNLLPAFKGSSEFPLVFEDDPHWNSAGHKLVAGVIGAEIDRLGWLADPPADQGQR